MYAILLFDEPDLRNVTFARPGDGCWLGSCSLDPFVLPTIVVALAIAAGFCLWLWRRKAS